MDISVIVAGLAVKYPVVATVLLGIGVLRAINKPLFALFHAFADASGSDKEKKLIDEAEGSSFYKSFCFVLDWFASVKLIKQ